MAIPLPNSDAGTLRGQRRRLRWVLLWLGAVLVIGLLEAVYFHLSYILQGKVISFDLPLIWLMTWSLAGGIAFLGVRWMVATRPLGRSSWPRRMPLYLVGWLAFGVSQTTLAWGLRLAAYRLAGLGEYKFYPNVPLAYAMDLPIQAIIYVLMVGILHALAALDAAKAREVRALHLETNLARAELRNLRLQIQPHFLFNAMNTISATMYRDVVAADEMLAQLAELLRVSLRSARSDEVALAEELDTVECYLSLMRARFGEALHVEVQVSPDSRGVLVPSMILQPLVENAIRHGNAERLGSASIVVRALVRDGRLALEVEDDGPGLGVDHGGPEAGTGLSVTAERLQLLYGSDHHFEAGNLAEGRPGFVVRVELPLRYAVDRSEDPARCAC